MQEKFNDVECIPQNVIELGFSPEVKKLLEDVEDLFARTGKNIYPLSFLPVISMVSSVGISKYFTDLEDSKKAQNQDRFYISIIFYSGIILTVLISFLIWLIHFYIWNHRSKRLIEIIDTFNAYSKPFGLFVNWNEDYNIYCQYRATRFRIRCNLCHKLPKLDELQPKLLFIMDVTARQAYCRDKGLDFELP